MKAQMIKILAAIIGIIGLLVMIVPILIYEVISDLKWKVAQNEQSDWHN
jgi:hypothetical protein